MNYFAAYLLKVFLVRNRERRKEVQVDNSKRNVDNHRDR